MPKIKSLFGLLLGLAVLFGLGNNQALAEMARGMSTSVLDITGEPKVGYIISHKGDSYTPANESFDYDIVGVVVENSSLALTDTSNQNSRLVMQKGEAQILVTNTAGDIKKGDYITSSNTPGVGQKADKNGFVVGRAMENLTVDSATNTGLVWSVIEPKYTYINNTMKTNLLDALRSGSLSPLLNSVESL